MGVKQTSFVLGTIESRRKGGMASYEARRYGHDIFTRKTIRKPRKSLLLAEFFGIMIGDGSVSKYQVSISFNLKDDREFATYVAKLIYTLFGISARILIRVRYNCLVLVTSSVELSNFLVSNGLPLGDKIRAGLDIPNWIKDDINYTKACLRGIFDTDGGVYQEIHKYKTRKYAYVRMAFVSASPFLVRSLSESLKLLGLHPKVRGERRVTIERFTDVEEYFRMVGSSNPKHVRRIAIFGGVG